jgi:excisionase family DNA binding protein
MRTPWFHSSRNSPPPDLLPEALLTSREVARLLAVSVRTLFRMVRAGRFPEPVRYNRRLVRWKRDEVLQYLQHL